MGFSKFVWKIGFKKGLLDNNPDIKYKFALYYFFTIVSELSELNKFSNISQGGKFLTLSENEKMRLRKEILDSTYNYRFGDSDKRRLDGLTYSKESRELDEQIFGLPAEEDIKGKKEVWNKVFGGVFFLSRIELEATSFTEHKLLRGVDLEATDPKSLMPLKHLWRATTREFFQLKNFLMYGHEWVRHGELQEVYDYLKKIL